MERHGADHLHVPVASVQRRRPDCQTIRARRNRPTRSPADVGHTIRFHVTAKNADGDDAGRVEPDRSRSQGEAEAPQATAAPVISGTPVVGSDLNATTGTWNGTKPITYTITWESCDLDITSA